VYFPIRPVCHFLSKASRQNLLLTVKRDNPNLKIGGLIEKAPDLIDEMVMNEGLTSQLIEITPSRLSFLKDFSTVIALGINGLMLFFYKRTYHYRNRDIPEWVSEAIEYLGIV